MSAISQYVSFSDAAAGNGPAKREKAKESDELSKKISTEAKSNYQLPTRMTKQNVKSEAKKSPVAN